MSMLITDELLNVLMISITCSIIVMSAVQKFKTLSFVNKENHIWFTNIVLSFTLGIPFSLIFFNLTICESIWVSIFTFIGAPTLYETLKSQDLIKYKPKSLKDTIEIPKENEIKTSSN